jgi:hypothetical protein
MKLYVRFDIAGLSVDDVIEGENAQEITGKAKDVVATKLGTFMGALVRSMSDLQFAQEVVRRYNAAHGSSCSLPTTVEEFVMWAIAEKLATVVE